MPQIGGLGQVRRYSGRAASARKAASEKSAMWSATADVSLTARVHAGGELGGIAGLFMAVPVTAMLSVVLRHWLGWRADDGEPVSS